MTEKVDWNCKKCGLEFMWAVSKANKGEEDFGLDHLEKPKTESDWKEAELYASDDGGFEWYWASETEACRECIKKMEKQGIKYYG